MNLYFCKHYVFGKQCRQKLKSCTHTGKGILDYIHLDAWGPSHIVSFGEASYFVTFIDEYSRKVWVFFIKIKADVFGVFKQFRVFVEKSTSRSIKYLRIDNGGEFTSLEFENYCKEAGIIMHKIVVYTP